MTIDPKLAVVRNALADAKLREISELDVRGITSIADAFFIATGTSTRHIKASADRVIDAIKLSGGYVIGVEGGPGAEWVLIDFGDIIVHIMTRDARDYYQLDKLWNSHFGQSSQPSAPAERSLGYEHRG